MRLNRYLASCGLGSRRSCETLVGEGRVFLNGKEVTDLATQVGPEDEVIVDGRKVRATASTTIILNKPPGFLCTRTDELGERRETIYDLLPAHFQSLHYVGRLDKDSEGLLILTNSGDLTEKLTHPRFGVEKEYLIAVDRVFREEEDREKLLTGFPIEGGFARATAVDVLEPRVIALTLTQGIKRQIRLMFEALGFTVQRLQRVRIGGLTMPELKSGRWRVLSPSETTRLLAAPAAARPPRRPLPKKSVPRRPTKAASSSSSARRPSPAPRRPGPASRPARASTPRRPGSR